MSVLQRCLAVLILFAGAPAAADGAPASQDDLTIEHDVTLSLLPAARRLDAEDVVSIPTLPPSHGPLPFLLHAGLRVESADPDWIVEAPSGPSGGELFAARLEEVRTTGVPLREYQLRPAAGDWPRDPKPRLRFHTESRHPPAAADEHSAGFSWGRGSIGAEGVVLDGSSYWLPWFGTELVRFRLTVTLPLGWEAVSQGKRTLHETHSDSRRVRWECPHLMDEVFLVASPFTEYSQVAAGITAYAFLREPDPKLARRYLEVTGRYIDMYGELIGPYPYQKFALVENFRETGYGMPSFTLLGSKVIRFPFILHTSYPHEILHNWWGNSVFVAHEGGNWSEGLTAYLADHLMSEARGEGIDYRRDSLRRYRGFVSEAEDFPLAEFGSRDSEVRQVIGYEKALMLWHMLRLRLGDEKFTEGLRRFYRRFRFRRASFRDLDRVFSEVAGEDLRPFFQQWVERSGAPALSMTAEGIGDRRIEVVVRQQQPGVPYQLAVPLAVTLEGEARVRLVDLSIHGRVSEFELAFPAPVLRLDLDPYFDVFRRLAREETPHILAEIFGAEKVTLVLPEEGKESMLEGWEAFAEAWSHAAGDHVEITREGDLKQLPEGRAVWVLGSHNRWSRALAPVLASRGAGLRDRQIHIGGKRLPEEGHSFVFVAAHPGDPERALAWLGADRVAALPGLARKLPHYSKYSYLGFSGDEPTNVAKGQWEVRHSPLVSALGADPGVEGDGGGSGYPAPRAALPPRRPLARLSPGPSPERDSRVRDDRHSRAGGAIGAPGHQAAENVRRGTATLHTGLRFLRPLVPSPFTL